MVIGTSICDMVVGTREVRLPGITGVVKDGILPTCWATRPDRWRWGTCWPGSCDCSGGRRRLRASSSGARRGWAPGRRGWWPWTGSTATARSSPTPTSPGRSSASRYRARPEQIYRALLESIAFGNRRIMDNFDRARDSADRDRGLGGIAETQPADDAVDRRHQRPPGTRARLARDPGAGARRCSGPWRPACIDGSTGRSPPPGRRRAQTMRPTPPRRASTTASTTIYRSLYDARPLPGRAAARAQAHRATEKERHVRPNDPKIGLLGIMQELYDEMIPGITEHQAALCRRGARSSSGPWPRSPSPARPATATTSRRSAAELARSRCRRRHDRDAHLRPGDAHDPRPDGAARPAAAGQHPAGAGDHRRVGHGQPDLQPGHPRRSGPGQRAAPRRGPVLGHHRRLALGRASARV